MGLRNKPLRYAHAEGHTDVCFSEDGQSIITCGRDGDVRIWAGIEDDDPNSHCVGERALAVRLRDGRLYVATDNHAVQAYTYPAFERDGIVTRFTAPVTHITTGTKLEVLGCASENMEAKICNPEGGAPICVMSEHGGPVLSVAICPKTKLATTSCGDGKLRIWDLDTQKVVQEIDCVPKINTFYSAKVLSDNSLVKYVSCQYFPMAVPTTLNWTENTFYLQCRFDQPFGLNMSERRADFEPTEGKSLAYPNNKEIVLFDTETMSQRMIFNHTTIKCAMSQCMFSPCGLFLAGSSVAGQVAVWQVASGECVGVVEHPTSHNVTAIAWNPKGNGVLAYCDLAGQLGVIENCYGKPSEAAALDDYDNIETENLDDNDDIVDNLIERYDSDDDDNAISVERLKQDILGGRGDEGSRDGHASRAGSAHRHVPAGVPPQPPFQPSATPTHLEHRYMCWNEVGIVRCHTSGEESSIEVEFHDASTHHGVHLNNYLNHTMAGLSSSVLALACEAPSKLVCISLLGSSKEWSVSMPETEEIVCVCAASHLVACATDARLLRLYTPMGIQRQVVSLAGPVVALAGFNSNILATYHATDPGLTDQHLAMDIVAMHGQLIRSKTVPVPLTPGSKLNWLGASEVGSPCSHDSAGVLRTYDISSGVWLPICDTSSHSKGASDTWFIVSVNERAQTVRGILCRGTTFPPTAPKPTVLQLPIQLPLCELETEKSQYEEQLVRWAHLDAGADAKAARETAMKLFALACRSELEQRALELVELLKDSQLLPIAAKYASRLGRMHLVDKLTHLSEAWEREEDQLNVAHNSHFDEVNSQESFVANGQPDLNVSLILPARTVQNNIETVTPIKPVPIKSFSGKRNPFKKQQEAAPSAPSPLSLTERTLVQVHSAPDEPTQENADPMKPQNGETFVDWFARNKEALDRDNTSLTPAELTKHAVRTFRAHHTKPPAEPEPEGRHKRKLDADEAGRKNGESAPVTSAPKQSKLSAFAFQKKPQTTADST